MLGNCPMLCRQALYSHPTPLLILCVLWCFWFYSIILFITGRPLFYIGLHLLQRHNVLNLDILKTMKFLGEYPFNSKTFETQSVLTYYYRSLSLFQSFNFYSDFQSQTHTHTAMVEEAYHPDNYYHNGTHAADVTQALHCLLSEPKVRAIMLN